MEEPPTEFSILRGSEESLLDLYSWLARGVSLAGGTIQKTLWLGLATSKAIDLSQRPFGSSCPRLQPPTDLYECDTHRAGRHGMDSAYEVSKVGNNRRDALELEIVSKDKNQVK